jgi:hypothetical protein
MPSSGRRIARSLTLAIAMVLYLAIGVFPFLGSVLLAPLPGVAFLMLGWALGLVAMVILMRRRSWWLLAGPPVALAFWAVVVTLGEHFLGWTA